MKNMTLERLAEACGGKLVFDGALPEQEAAGVVIDSRKVEKDFLFLAVKGERTDGHRYIPDVFAKGALQAAKFLKGKAAGMYDMSDVIDG